jgi:TDG/mug DNA glycosylase family protein
MKAEQVNLRLEEDLLEELERVSEEEALDRATMIRRLLRDSLKRWHLDRALRGYERGEVSIGRAAEEAGLSQWELMDVIRREGVTYRMSAADVRERLADLDAMAGPSKGRRRGFQVELKWLGATVTTLADVPPRPGGILLVGINPAPVSVAAGHYYQGRIGRRLWSRLARLGLLDEHTPGAEDEAFARRGHGLTDLVKRPTGSASELGEEELRAGLELLAEHVRQWQPGLIVFAFKRAAAAMLGPKRSASGQGPTFQGIPTFLLSGPYAPASEAEQVDRQLSLLVAELGESTPRPMGRGKGARKDNGPTDLDDGRVIRRANALFGSQRVRLYMDTERQSEAARALDVDPKRLRGITRDLGTRVSEGDPWDKKAKLATLAEIIRRMR